MEMIFGHVRGPVIKVHTVKVGIVRPVVLFKHQRILKAVSISHKYYLDEDNIFSYLVSVVLSEVLLFSGGNDEFAKRNLRICMPQILSLIKATMVDIKLSLVDYCLEHYVTHERSAEFAYTGAW